MFHSYLVAFLFVVYYDRYCGYFGYALRWWQDFILSLLHTHTYTYTHEHTHTHAHTQMHTPTHPCTHKNTRIHTRTHAPMHICICIHIHMHIHTCLHAHRSAQMNPKERKWMFEMYAQITFLYLHNMCIYTRTGVFTCTEIEWPLGKDLFGCAHTYWPYVSSEREKECVCVCVCV